MSGKYNETLLNTLGIFRDAIGLLKDNSNTQGLHNFLDHIDAYCFLLRDYLTNKISHSEPIVRTIFEKLGSFLRSPDPLDKKHSLRKMNTLRMNWGKSKTQEEKVSHIQNCLGLNSAERREEMILLFRGFVTAIQSQLLTSAHTRRDNHISSKNILKPLYSVRIGAVSAFEALDISSKACSHSHKSAARLRLATHRQQMEDRCRFDTLVSLDKACHAWHEIQIQATLSSAAPKKKPMTESASLQNNCANRRALTHRRLAVERLCEQIEKIKSKPLMRLNLLVEDGKLWKNQSSKSEHHVDRSDSLLSLKDIVESRPTSLTEKVKRVLAVFLAYSLLHLRGTPWLRPSSFKAANIMFYSTSTAIPLKPYIHVYFAETDGSSGQPNETDEGIDPDDLPMHPFPDIVMLAMLLMEIYMIQPIESLAEQVDMPIADWSCVDENTNYLIAVAVFDRFKADFTDSYRGAVDRCLDPNIGFNDNDEELNQEDLNNLIYEEVVHPLENELDRGFGNTIQIDNLDELAQTIDMNRFGQMPHSQQHSPQVRDTKSVPGDLNGPSTPVLPPNLNNILETGKAPNHPTHRHQDYTIGWICALPNEMAAAQAMLDEHHASLPKDANDKNTYTLGRMGVHNVVMTCLPAGVTGTVAAARVAGHMRSTFRGTRLGLMVGIGGGVPDVHDIRFGDVVVGVPSGCLGGVVQYDFGKTVQDHKFLRTGSLNRPPDELLSAVSRLKADHLCGKVNIENYINETFEDSQLSTEFSYPGAENDLLYQNDYDHAPANDNDDCQKCDPTKVVLRKPRNSACPRIHYGLIASGNQVMRHGTTRTRLAKELGAICFEMEAAGLVDSFPCLVIRGICDYSDSHKNKRWQGYAAVTAAAYAKELLSVIPKSHGDVETTTVW
ncbi:purine and uridine phosphorylase [Aspergillus steynii IBT 23096]|uniref:Purine and uridine phosphorylase n=1 Tax=Aspergillus steynii IBT 23096 TaxID=1392250 RepID=A0A2I2G7H9_9EURO|nr:purine and uridine phosphorylase [Aspergillus steynii IBT 23096]PLB48839.1 purine and uridine phosphorylase [Aspergillus steynii IBT 23096]